MKKLMGKGKHAALLAGAVLAIVLVALAAKPTMAAKPSAGTSSIALNPGPQVTGWPGIGSAVTFATNATGLAGWEWPMVGVACYQSGVTVFAQLDTPSATFVLGGGSSVWLQNGGSANCTATLFAYGSKGQQETIRSLAATSFTASGS